MRKLWNCCLFLFLFLSCLVSADESLFDWSSAAELYPGIQHVHLALQEPRLLKLNAVRIDLSRPEIKFHTTPRAEEWGKPMLDCPEHTVRTKRQRTRAYLAQARLAKNQGGYGLNMVLAINAAPWVPWKTPFTHTWADKLGLTVLDGELVSPANKRPSLLIYRDKRVAMGAIQSEEEIKDLQVAVTGFSFVLQKGKVSGVSKLQPRTGYGISEDRKYLILLTVDGRRKEWSLGAGTDEVGQWLKHFGAWDGLNMDGGGSSSLAYLLPNEENETIVLLNKTPGGERSVANNLGVYIMQDEK